MRQLLAYLTNLLVTLPKKAKPSTKMSWVATVTILTSLVAAIAASIDIAKFFADTRKSSPIEIVMRKDAMTALSGGKIITTSSNSTAFEGEVRTDLHILSSKTSHPIVIHSIIMRFGREVPLEIKEALEIETEGNEITPHSYAGSRHVNQVYALIEETSFRVGYQTEETMELCMESNLLSCGRARVIQLDNSTDASADFKINAAMHTTGIKSIFFEIGYFYDGVEYTENSDEIYIFN